MSLTLKSNRVKVPAGKYWLGDPCYITSSEDWSKVCDAFYLKENEGKSIIQVDLNGNLVVLCQTAWGDGEYLSSKGHSIPVDSGTIGLVPHSYDPEFKSNFDLMSLVEFPLEATVENIEGIMWFDTIRVDTRD